MSPTWPAKCHLSWKLVFMGEQVDTKWRREGMQQIAPRKCKYGLPVRNN